MSLPGRKWYCVFGCTELGAYMHSFPHPQRRSELFKTWVSTVGDKMKETGPWRIYRNKKVCDMKDPAVLSNQNLQKLQLMEALNTRLHPNQPSTSQRNDFADLKPSEHILKKHKTAQNVISSHFHDV